MLAGWDPVTGWGTVNYPSLSAMYNVTSYGATSSGPAGPRGPAALLPPLLLLLLILASLLL